jgi:hypothetical protein
MKRKVVIIILILLIPIIVSIYIHKKYFFNPITFKQDSITYLPFTWYEKPLTYSYISRTNGKIKGKNIKNDKDINFMYKELKKSKLIGPIISMNRMIENKPLAGELIIYSSKSGECVVTDIRCYGRTSDICEVSGQITIGDNKINTDLLIKPTSNLKKFFDKKFIK